MTDIELTEAEKRQILNAREAEIRYREAANQRQLAIEAAEARKPAQLEAIARAKSILDDAGVGIWSNDIWGFDDKASGLEIECHYQ